MLKTEVGSWWLSLQHDWPDGFKNAEKVWVSAHRLNSPTCHSYITADGPTDRNFAMTMMSERQVKLCHVESNTTTRFTAPVCAHKITPNNNPVSLDVTSAGGLGAVADGKDVLVFEGATGNVRRTLSGHVADVECVKFFPSNKVLLTGGSDMCVKIWSVEDGSCPVTLAGHKRGITSLDMIDRGKEVVSSSLDGTIKVWVCGTQQCVATVAPQSGAINQTHILSQEQGGTDRLLMSATEAGKLTIHNVQDGTFVSQYQHSSELTTCTAISRYLDLVVAGSSTGDIITLDIRYCTEPVSVHKRSNYAITSLSYSDDDRLWCGQKDGEVYTVNPDTADLHCDTTLSGGDCEAIYSVVARSGVVCTAARDRMIRRYEV